MHADLHRGNLLVPDGEPTGVIVWDCAAAGDLMTAWLFLDGAVARSSGASSRSSTTRHALAQLLAERPR